MASDAFVAAVRDLAPEFGLALADETVDRFRRHYELLVTWNRKLNLTRIVDPTEAARRHFLESAYLATLVERPGSFVDVGSGAGFPGLPLACMWPESEAILVEPLVKRAVFLKETVRSLGLPRDRRRARSSAVGSWPWVPWHSLPRVLRFPSTVGSLFSGTPIRPHLKRRGSSASPSGPSLRCSRRLFRSAFRMAFS